MGSILAIVFPIYAALGIGYGAVRWRWFRAGDLPVLGRYVMAVALPALLFRAVATRPLAEVFHPGYLAVYAAGGLATIALAFVWFSWTAPDRGRRGVAVLGSACPNSGFIGYPMMLLAFPEVAAQVLALSMLVENILLIPLMLMILDSGTRASDAGASDAGASDAGDSSTGASGARPGAALKRLALDLLKRPMIVGLLCGLAVSVAGLSLPAALVRLLDMLAASAAPLSLFVIGGSLAGLPMTGNRILAVQIAVAKLVAQPGLTLLAALGFGALGMAALPPNLFAGLILTAALPMMGIYTVLAQERGLGGAASIAMLVATTAGFFTLSALLAWFT